MKTNKAILVMSGLIILFSVNLCGCSNKQVDKASEQDLAVDDEHQYVLGKLEPIITEVDWSNYFEGINGAAVIYDPIKNCYQIYNQELALTQRSPCSTFKIISSLIALENGIIRSDSSTRTWSGEIFLNEEWNRDIDFSDAFRSSCVWYFREVIDEVGRDAIQEELYRLEYGNCDISDWDGRLNANTGNPALTGFWIESSLLISPKEQVKAVFQFMVKQEWGCFMILSLMHGILVSKIPLIKGFTFACT